MNRFDREFWRRLWRLAKPYWVSDQKRPGIVLLIAIIAIVLVLVGIGAIFTYISRDMLNALQARNQSAFWAQLWKFIALSFAHRAFYEINTAGHVDNPDQRISEDIGTFSSSTITFLLTFLNSPITGITYFVILWTISPKLAVFLLAYAAVGTYGSVLVGRRLVSINFNQQRYEADFRFGLVHVRDHAESIAMYGGEAYEERQLLKRFAHVVSNFKNLILWQRHLGFVTAAYNDPVDLLPWILLAGAYFAGKVELGQLNQAAIAFSTLKGAISVFVDKFNDIATYACVVNRLSEYEEHCEQIYTRIGDDNQISCENDSR